MPATHRATALEAIEWLFRNAAGGIPPWLKVLAR